MYRRILLLLVCLQLPSSALHAFDEVASLHAPSQPLELEKLREEIARIEHELQELEGLERGLLGELRRLDTELRLRRAQVDEVSLELGDVEDVIARRDASIAELERLQSVRRGYLAFRLREAYKSGTAQELQRFVGGDDIEDYWTGLRYAAYLGQRDTDLIESYRADRELLSVERAELGRARSGLVELESSADDARSALDTTRRRRAATLLRVRDDQELRRTALGELEQAARELSETVTELGATVAGGRVLDMKKFQGLLDWPTIGELTSGFGTVIHPQFRTEVPHPGWDIAASFGADIRTVFDGVVVYGAWMRGYGLTTIVDHGGGLLSIYAHASVLLVEKGERVLRGQLLGKVGDSGSLRGAMLYFELRVEGSPVDPRPWLRQP
jgi:septal ring factor EnvC (AmiA/AmiB activator)